MKTTHLFIWGACLLVGSWSQQLSAMDGAAGPRNYAQLIADSDIVKAIRDRLNFISPLAVSKLRPSVLTQPGDLMACVRVSDSGLKAPKVSNGPIAPPHQPVGGPSLLFYALFFGGGAIVDSRPAVIIDRCADMTYSPLPQPTKVKKPDW